MIFKRLSFYARFGSLILFLTGLAAPFLIWGAASTIRSNTNKVADWLPDTYTETGDLRWFREHFVADQFVIISWEGCTLGGDPALATSPADDPRIEKLAQLLVPAERDADQVPHSEASVPKHFKAVTTGRRLLNQLTATQRGVPYDIAVNRLKGSVVGDDGRQTCVVVTLTDEAISDLKGAIGRQKVAPLRRTTSEGALFSALRQCDIDLDTLHLGGPPVDNIAIDEEGEKTMVRLAGLAALFGIGLAWWSLRSVVLTAIVFGCGILSAAASLAMVSWTGSTSDAVVLSMPSLIYVLAISGAVHLINYYRTALKEQGPESAPEWAIAHGWKPAFLCSATTALGLLSLCASDLTPIRKFGFYAAIGVMLTLVVLFTFLPAALHAWPLAKPKVPAKPFQFVHPSHQVRGSRIRKFFAKYKGFWHWFGGGIIRHHAWVMTVCIVVIAGFGLGIERTRTNVDLMKLFDGKAKILHDYRWLEGNIGPLVPMEVVLRFDQQLIAQEKLSLLERIRIVHGVQQAIDKRFGESGEDLVGPSISAATFVPPLPSEKRGTLALLRRTATNSKFEQSYPSLRESGYLEIDSRTGDELWRISIRVVAFKDVDYGQFSSQLRAVVDPLLSTKNNQLAPGLSGDDSIQAVYTGVVPIVYKAQRALLNSLIESTCWSFLTITPLLMIVSRGVRAGAVTMLPNALPLLVIFGGMGWLGLPIDIGSMMSASIALGVAVDDTIHYLTWFRDHFDKTGDRKAAILHAYEHCATPTLQAALINGLGLSVFAFSSFTPTRQFGVLMLAILIAGVVAELILLPALLAGPLGTVFTRSKKRQASDRPSQELSPLPTQSVADLPARSRT